MHCINGDIYTANPVVDIERQKNKQQHNFMIYVMIKTAFLSNDK